MLVENSLARQLPVLFLLFLRQRSFLRRFLGNPRLGMELVEARITTIDIDFDFRMDVNFALFQKTEVVLLSVGKICANHLGRFLIDDDLRF